MSAPAYAYQATLYCERCGEHLKRDLERKGVEDTGDSGDFPQYADDGGGEADSPQHCDDCRVFLENPLTHDGLRYVKEQISRAMTQRGKRSTPLREPLQTWANFYEIPTDPYEGDDLERTASVKVANANDLQAELRRITAMAAKPNPSRTRIASELHALAVRLADVDYPSFNASLLKILPKLKREAPVANMRQGYKGTGSKAGIFQVFVRFEGGASVDLWLKNDRVEIKSLYTETGETWPNRLTATSVDYEGRSPEQVFAALAQILKAYATV